jgi:hypothetical protein
LVAVPYGAGEIAMSSDSERSLVARIAAHESWATTINRADRTANARAGLDAKFLELANGDPARAAQLRKAHFLRHALKSAQSRRRKATRQAKDTTNRRSNSASLPLRELCTPLWS